MALEPFAVARAGLETGPLSVRLWNGLKERGVPNVTAAGDLSAPDPLAAGILGRYQAEHAISCLGLSNRCRSPISATSVAAAVTLILRKA